MITNWDYKRLTLWILTQLLRHPVRVGLGPISIIFLLSDLTATERAGSRLPKSSKMLITAEMSTIAQKLLKRLPLKFKNESFGAIKIFRRKFHWKWTKNWPELTFLRPRMEFWITRNTSFMSVLIFKHPTRIKWLGSRLPPRSVGG